MDLRKELFAYQDLEYKAFHQKLVPNIDADKIIGIRVPNIRKVAKQAFLENADNQREYYEEKMIYGLTLGMKKCSTEEHIEDIKQFVKYIDNWGVCDTCVSSFKFVKKDLNAYYDLLKSFINDTEYETRFGVTMLMDYYLDDEHIDDVLETLINIKSDYYYVNMAVAWALSDAFVKYEAKTMPIIQSMILSKDVQNKTIQKIKDSFRVDKETKQLLNDYKIK